MGERDPRSALPAEVRYPADQPLVWRDRDRVSGTLCFHGTRVPVDIPVALLQEGASLSEFLEGYPSVSRGHVTAVLDLMLGLLDEATPLEGS